MANQAGSHVVRFDRFEVDLDTGRLLKCGVRRRLRAQAFQVLVALLERDGQVVTREHLRRLLWPDHVFVDFDGSLNAVVAHLREVLNDSAAHPHFVETLPKRGYRFIAAVDAPPATPAGPVRRRARLVVLPFVSWSDDPAREHVGDAMTDEVITDLGSLAHEPVAVIARTTAMRYKGSPKDVARIARELGVDYVVEGALRRNAQQVVVNVQLIQASDQTHLLARRYEVAPDELVQVHSAIARDIATHLGHPGDLDAPAAG